MFPLLILTAVREVGSILCYNCTTASDSNCEALPRSTKWIECNGACQVWKLYSEADSKTYMFERFCNEYCHQGCTHLADMEHRFVGEEFHDQPGQLKLPSRLAIDLYKMLISRCEEIESLCRLKA